MSWQNVRENWEVTERARMGVRAGRSSVLYQEVRACLSSEIAQKFGVLGRKSPELIPQTMGGKWVFSETFHEDAQAKGSTGTVSKIAPRIRLRGRSGGQVTCLSAGPRGRTFGSSERLHVSEKLHFGLGPLPQDGMTFSACGTEVGLSGGQRTDCPPKAALLPCRGTLHFPGFLARGVAR